jgi:hypothetical protein
MEVKAGAKTARVKLRRSIFLNGQHCEVGEIHDVPVELAEYLVSAESAVPCRWETVKKFFRRFRRRPGADPRFN